MIFLPNCREYYEVCEKGHIRALEKRATGQSALLFKSSCSTVENSAEIPVGQTRGGAVRFANIEGTALIWVFALAYLSKIKKMQPCLKQLLWVNL